MSNPNSQISSVTIVARLLYSDSVELLGIVDYVFDFHDARVSPNLTRKPFTDLLVMEHAVQSASQYVVMLFFS